MRKNFLMLGHSNMCDQGSAADLPVFENAAQMFVYRETTNWLNRSHGSTEAFIYNNPGYWTQAVDVIEPAGVPNTQTCGPLQLAFANRMAGILGCEIGLVPHALGGSTISQWSEYHRQNAFFGMACQRAFWAQSQGDLTGIVCWLGENDTFDSTTANNISLKYGNMLNALRVTLGNLNLPIIIVKPGNETHTDRPYWDTMRTEIDAMTLSNFAVVNTDDIPPKAGDVHFTLPNYIIIGNRIADAMTTLL